MRDYKSMGVKVPMISLVNKALHVAKKAGIEWDFKASCSWLDGFSARHSIKWRSAQWLGVLVKDVDPVTGNASNAIISGFKKTGLWPFSRAALKDSALAANKWWKAKKEIARDPAVPFVASPLRPKLTLSKEDLIALRAEAFDVNVVLDLGVEKAIEAAPRTKMAELLTSSGWLAKQAAEETLQAAGKAAAAEKAAAKAAALAARGGLTKAAFDKQEKSKAKAAAAAAAAASAAEAAAKPAEPAAPTQGEKRKREAVDPPPAAVKAVAAKPAGNVYAKQFAPKRGKTV